MPSAALETGPAIRFSCRPLLCPDGTETGQWRALIQEIFDFAGAPRGLYLLSAVNGLGLSGTTNRSMTFQGFFWRTVPLREAPEVPQFEFCRRIMSIPMMP